MKLAFTFKRTSIVGIIFVLVFALLPINTFAANSNDKQDMTISETAIDNNTTMMEIENNSSEKLEVKETKGSDKSTYETYLDGEYVDETIIHHDSDKVEYIDADGNTTTSSLDDFIVDKESNDDKDKTLEEADEDFFVDSKSNEDKNEVVEESDNISGDAHINYNPPSGYSLYGEEYSSEWGHTGYAYGKSSVEYGPTKEVQFSKGTAVSTIIGVIGGIFSGGIGGILLALGATVVGSTIDTAVDGDVYARTTTTKYEVISQNQLGLRTNKGVVDAKVVNHKNGEVSWEHLRDEGDARSLSDLIHAGIYNVVIDNQ